VKFSIFRIPVRVQPLFLAIALFIAPPTASIFGGRWSQILAWVGVVFCSVLGHELGHALVARRFGAEVDITLHGLGGYTRWHVAKDIGPWRRVIVAAAGSLTGFALAGVLWLVLRSDVLPTTWRLLDFAIGWFITVNILWGVLNWLPIRPLDGGHMLLGVLQAFFGERGVTIANVIFPVATVAGGLLAWSQGFIIAALFALFLLFGEFRAWNERSVAARGLPVEEGPFTLFGHEEAPHADRSAPVDAGGAERGDEDLVDPPDEGTPPAVG
jgi:stage IV sporulation protein FB